MLFLTRLFGVTASEADRDITREPADIEQIITRSLLMQANSASQQRRPIGRGTHVKGVCARAEFEVFDVTEGRDSALAERLAKGLCQAWRLSRYCAVWKCGSEEEFRFQG
jgi:hypothetical protein